MRRPFIVIRTRGAVWDDTQSLEGQRDWAAHAAFMDAMVDEGFIVLGGPLEGTRDVVLVFQAEDRAEIERRLAVDPWTRSGQLVTKECRPWRIRLGSLAPR
ncbi:MAG: YciI family protein [Candidatus Eiseniibacteriota bacterium]